MYSDVTNLIEQKGSKLDIVYSDPQHQAAVKKAYGKTLSWPQDFQNGVTYKVTDLNNSLGYDTIQDAVSSFATYEGQTVQVKAGTYQENVAVTKPLTLTCQAGTATVQGQDNGTALAIRADNVTVTGFTIQNNPSELQGTGILLETAHGCTLTDNHVSDNYIGIFMVDSTANVFRSNVANGNSVNLLLQNSPNNDIDSSNVIGGKPYSGS
jgi:parallel beta-helix repeat protein